jgi:hypothetical protein
MRNLRSRDPLKNERRIILLKDRRPRLAPASHRARQVAGAGASKEPARYGWFLAHPYPIERSNVRAHWLFGSAQRVAGQFDEAERHLQGHWNSAGASTWRRWKPTSSLTFARLRAATHAPYEAQRLAEEALLIIIRAGIG